MPRIPHSLLLKAYNISRFLPLVLRGVRDLPSAINELRWLTEHSRKICKTKNLTHPIQRKSVLLQLCQRRERSEPLQYILGSQPFGNLEIKCRKGVLIPRPETEAYTVYVATLLQQNRLPGIDTSRSKIAKVYDGLQILDVCSGTGCISLYLRAALLDSCTGVGIWAIDNSPAAISLALANYRALGPALGGKRVHFRRQDIFAPVGIFARPRRWEPLREHMMPAPEIIIANPPYIEKDELRSLSRSVQKWEPKSALVPISPAPVPSSALVAQNASLGENNVKVQYHEADIFYARILDLQRDLYRAGFLLMEIGSDAQARRVAGLARDMLPPDTYVVEIWRDQPDASLGTAEKEEEGDILEVPTRGLGKLRSVVVYRSKFADRDVERLSESSDAWRIPQSETPETQLEG